MGKVQRTKGKGNASDEQIADAEAVIEFARRALTDPQPSDAVRLRAMRRASAGVMTPDLTSRRDVAVRIARAMLPRLRVLPEDELRRELCVLLVGLAVETEDEAWRVHAVDAADAASARRFGPVRLVAWLALRAGALGESRTKRPSAELVDAVTATLRDADPKKRARRNQRVTRRRKG